jgi:hypothetical protein
MCPLGVSEVEEISSEAGGPLPGRPAGLGGAVMGGLEQLPGERHLSFGCKYPANVILFLCGE